MDLLGRERRTRRGGELSRVERLTVRKTPYAGVLARLRNLLSQQVAHARECRQNALAHFVARRGNEFGGAAGQILSYSGIGLIALYLIWSGGSDAFEHLIVAAALSVAGSVTST